MTFRQWLRSLTPSFRKNRARGLKAAHTRQQNAWARANGFSSMADARAYKGEPLDEKAADDYEAALTSNGAHSVLSVPASVADQKSGGVA